MIKNVPFSVNSISCSKSSPFLFETSLENSDDALQKRLFLAKKAFLHVSIYDNAITDRLNAYMLFTGTYTNMGASLADNISVGPTLAKYLERMNKSNDQLIKLAELVAKEEERSEALDPEDIFKKIDKLYGKYRCIKTQAGNARYRSQ